MGRTSTRSSSGSRVAAILLPVAALAAWAGVASALDGGPEIRPETVVGDRVCALCHRDRIPEIRGSVHGRLARAGHPETCEGCHGPGGGHVLSAVWDPGKPGKIVRFEELSKEASSRRCLACHETRAKNKHVREFLSSKLLAGGQACADCHLAHGPAGEKAPPPAPKPSPRIGTQACLLCHSDRPETVRFSHRPRVEDLLGCESCHGAGRSHAESRGAPGTIRNPGKMEKGKADRSCLLCHGDRRSGHFVPRPGKERCADCHTIHVPPPPAVPVRPERPGRPAFRVAAAGSPPAPSTNPYRQPSLPPRPGAGLELLGFSLSGAVRAGGRFTGVAGSDRIYDQDLGFDSGPRLFDLRLDATSPGGPVQRLLLTAEGVDDPVERYGLSVRGGGFALTAKGKRENLVYRASADPRDISARRDELSLALALFPDAPFRVTLGLDLDERDGRRRGGRLLPGGVSAVREPFEETGRRAFVTVDLSRGPLDLSLTPSYRWEELDDGIRSAPPAKAPNPYLRHRAKTEVRTPLVALVGRYAAAEDLSLDGKLLLGRVDTETDGRTRTTGAGGGAGSVEKVREDVDGERDLLQAEIGALWLPLPSLSFGARLERRVERTDSDGSFATRTFAPPGSTPAVTRERERIERDQRRLRAVLEGSWRPGEWGAVRAGYERVDDEFELTENGRRRDHDAVIDGPYLSLDLDPRRDLSAEILYRFVRVDEPFAEISTQDRDQVRLRSRWQASDELGLTGFWVRSLATNRRRDTEVLSWSGGLSALWAPLPEVSIEAGADYQTFSTETDAVRFLSGTPVFGRSEFTGRTRGFHLTSRWEIAPDLRVRGGGSLVDTTGDFPARLFDLTFGIEAELGHALSDLGVVPWGSPGPGRDRVVLGTDLRFTSYDEKDARVDDYDAYGVELWLRVRF